MNNLSNTRTAGSFMQTFCSLCLIIGLLVFGQPAAWADYQVALILPSQPAPQPVFDILTKVAAAPDGSVWVVDFSAADQKVSIQHFSADGSLTTKFGSYGPGNGQFQSPSGIAVATDGSVWVADSTSALIQHFDPQGTYLSSFSAATYENNGNQIALSADGSLWVLNTPVVQHFNTDGTLIGQFNQSASGIAAAPDGSIWLHTTPYVISHFKPDGSLIGSFSPGSIYAFSVGPDGSVLVYKNGTTTSYSPGMQRYGADAVLIDTLGISKGNALGQIAPYGEQIGIAVAVDGSIWVFDAPAI